MKNLLGRWGHQSVNHEEDIHLMDYWKLLVKRKKLVIGIPLVLIVIAFIVTFFMPRIYLVEAYFGINTPNLLSPKFIPNEKKPSLTRKELIKDLDHPNTEKLVRIFGEYSKEIKSLNFITDYITDAYRFKVKIKLAADHEKIPKVLKALQDYFPSIREYAQFKKETIKFLELELNEVKRLHKTYSEFSQLMEKALAFNQWKILTYFNLIEVIYNKEIEFRFKKQQIEDEIKKLNNLTNPIRLEEVIVSRYPLSPRALVVVAGVIGLFVGIFFAFVAEYRDALKGEQ